MKIKYEHYEHLRRAMESVLRDFPTVEDYEKQGVPDAPKRHRWDAFYKAGLVPYACREIYPYADNSNLDYALTRIVRGFQAKQKK